MALSAVVASTFTDNVRRFSHEIREIFLDFLRWDEEDEAAVKEANATAIDDPASGAVKLPQGGWKVIQRRRRPTRVDFPVAQYDASEFARLLTFDLKVDNLWPQKELLARIMRVKFNSPTPYGMDATWEGNAMQCQYTDLSGRIGKRDSFTYTPSWSVIRHKVTIGNP